MDISSRTSEGGPCRCSVCGKVSIVELSPDFADSVCSHCGSLMFPRLMLVRGHDFMTDDERVLAGKGILVVTDDQGEITKVELCGPHIFDGYLLNLRALNGIPHVQIGNTSLSKTGKTILASILDLSFVEDLNAGPNIP